MSIKVDEIVRAMAHLGKNKKHTIVMFVTPSCVHRLEKRLHVSNSDASMIALFLPALSVDNISRLLHTFHNMSKQSLFGASLFTEVEQRTIFNVLVNIAPDIRMRHKAPPHAPSSSSSALQLQVDSGGGSSLWRSHSMPVQSNPPGGASGAGGAGCGGGDSGALDLTVARPNGMFHSASVDSPATVSPVAPSPSGSGGAKHHHHHQSKAYKPKFHFRSNRYLILHRLRAVLYEYM